MYGVVGGDLFFFFVVCVSLITIGPTPGKFLDSMQGDKIGC